MPEDPPFDHRHDVDAEWQEYAPQRLLLSFLQFLMQKIKPSGEAPI